jgi:NADH-quinone oxidoreductase subunit A
MFILNSNIIYFNNNYSEIFLFLLISFFLGCILFLLPSLLAFRNSTVEKLSAYECGFEPFSDAHNIFDVHFVVVAILFLLFDFELLLLYPFVLSYSLSISYYGPFFLFNLFFFLFLLFVAFLYEWLSGALIWPIFVKKL